MLTIKTTIGPSNIDGIGLFAAEGIRKGQSVWVYNPHIDILLSQEQLRTLSAASLVQIQKYAFVDKKYQKYLLCGDDARFFNHAPDPNCDESVDDVTVALRDIESGEELTVDYFCFYGNVEEHPELVTTGVTRQ